MISGSAHILHVDDDAGLVRLVERASLRRGYTLKHADNVADGLKLLDEHDFDIVVLDHNLATGTGLDFLKELAARENAPPILYVTGSVDAQVAIAALKAGAADYVTKSAGGEFLELLFSAIEQALENAHLKSEKLKAELEVREARDRAELMLREVNHRIANSLSLVSALVRMQASSLKDQIAKDALAETQARIAAIAGIHRRLYTSTDVGSVPLHEYLKGLSEELDASMKATMAYNVTIRLDAEPVSIGTDKAISVGVMVTELVTNIFKYAYANNETGEARIGLRHTGSGKLELSVEDDGCGWNSDTAPKGTGLGAKIVKAMAKNLGSEIRHEDLSPGTRIAIEFDKDETA
jgi:two-component sensor histidine kinase/CheY-like chemotaxis protein